ncbi:MAG: hypothetical protein J6V17_01700, partial [Bacteroidales bacterium]|nr:hypothetical protein [Bacteroidales bacterium]
MRLRIIVCLCISALLGCFAPCKAERLRVTSSQMEIVLDAVVGEELKILYFGPSLTETDFANISWSGIKPYAAYPAYGRLTVYEPGFEPA